MVGGNGGSICGKAYNLISTFPHFFSNSIWNLSMKAINRLSLWSVFRPKHVYAICNFHSVVWRTAQISSNWYIWPQLTEMRWVFIGYDLDETWFVLSLTFDSTCCGLKCNIEGTCTYHYVFLTIDVAIVEVRLVCDSLLPYQAVLVAFFEVQLLVIVHLCKTVGIF